MRALVLLGVNQHTKFEMPSFTHSKNMNVAPILKVDHSSLTTPFSGVVCRPCVGLRWSIYLPKLKSPSPLVTKI